MAEAKEAKGKGPLIFIEAKWLGNHQYCLGQELMATHEKEGLHLDEHGELKPFLVRESELTDRKKADIALYHKQLKEDAAKVKKEGPGR